MHRNNILLPNPNIFKGVAGLEFMSDLIRKIENTDIEDTKAPNGLLLSGRCGIGFFKITPFISRHGLQDIQQWGVRNFYYLRNMTAEEMNLVDCVICQNEDPYALNPGLSYIIDSIKAGVPYINSLPVFAKTTNLVEPFIDVVDNQASLEWRGVRNCSSYSGYFEEAILTPQQWAVETRDIFSK